MQRLIANLLIALLLLGVVPASPTAAADDVRTVLVNAMRKTSKATTYRMELSIAATGALGAIGGGSNIRMTLMDVRGEVSGGNSHMTIGGFFVSFFGASQSGIEMMQVEGVSYLKGPLPSLGAPLNRWYRSAKGQRVLGDSQSVTTPGTTLKGLESANLNWMKKLDSAQVDGQQCIRYGSTDIAAIMRGMQSLSSNPSDAVDLTGMKKGDVAFVVCEDGMLHKVSFHLEGTDPKNPKSPVTVDAQIRTFDFGSKIQIAAPANALPLESPAGAAPAEPALPTSGKEINATPGVKVINGGNIRSTPSTSGSVLGQLHANDPVELLARNGDGSWLRVSAPAATGWVSATLLRVPKDTAAALPTASQAAAPAPGAELTASVFNGGNVRAAPTLKGKVLDQINAGETVVLLAKNSAGSWYRITNVRGVSGWVSATLLTVDPAMAGKVPVE